VILLNKEEKIIWDKLIELYELISKTFDYNNNYYDKDFDMLDVAKSLRNIQQIVIMRAVRRHINYLKDLSLSAKYKEGSPEIDDDPDVIDL
jgi:predicted DNA-binding protein YlxM (UPF0122 family)